MARGKQSPQPHAGEQVPAARGAFPKAILASGVMLIHPGKSLVTLSLTSAGENPTWVEKETWDISLQ